MEFVASRREGCSHTVIAQGLDIPKSSLSALLHDLHSTGYLQRNPETGVFTIGVQVLWLANSYLRNLNLVRLGQPVVAQLFARVREFALLAIPTGTEYVTICTESLPSVFAHTLQVGQRGPLVTSAVGRAMLAYMAPGEVDRILAAPPDAGTVPLSKQAIADIRKQLDVARKRGIGYSYEESIPGVVGIAAPVFNAAGTPVAALGVGIPSAQMKGRDTAPIEEALRQAAAALSGELGYAPSAGNRKSRSA